MPRLGSRFILGATLFSTPGMKSGMHASAVMSLVAALLVVVVPVALYQLGRSKPSPPNPGGDDGWRKRPDPPPPPRPRPGGGGIPLDDAVQAKARLRGTGRLADHIGPRVRRPAREPERTPVRG